MAKLNVITRANGTITNRSAAVLRGKGHKVKNGTLATEVVTSLESLGHTVTVTSVFSLKPSQATALNRQAKAARAKIGAKVAA